LPKADVVVAAYVLAELTPGQLGGVVSALWAACNGLLVLVEPGTPAGYARLMAARAQLIASGAAMVAPCPHAERCPIQPPDWCHFSERLPRSRDHMRAKRASVPFEDEKFAYIVLRRDIGPIAAIDARILAPPRDGKAGLNFKLCTAEGIVERAVPRRDRTGFAHWRRLKWGDAFSETDN
jgi:ribosomal protein RSM22 (predicted rRNA methylase)